MYGRLGIPVLCDGGSYAGILLHQIKYLATYARKMYPIIYMYVVRTIRVRMVYKIVPYAYGSYIRTIYAYESGI